MLADIRTFEIEIRNEYAHDIVSMTSKVIKDKSGFSPKEIMKKIKNVYQWIYHDLIKQINWDLYRDINNHIENSMEGEIYG